MEKLSQCYVFKISLEGNFVGKTSRKSARKKLKSYAKANEFCFSIGIAGKDGKVVASSDKKQRGASIANQAFFQSTMKGEMPKPPVRLNPKTKSTSFVISLPIKDDEKIIGIMFADIDLKYFTDRFLDNVKIGKSGYVFLIDQYGGIIYHPDETIDNSINIHELEWGKQRMEKPKGDMKIDWNGKRLLVSYAVVPDLGWGILSVMDNKEINQTARKISTLNLAASVILMLVAIACSLLISRRISSPLIQVTTVMNEIKNGNFSVRIGQKAVDEIGLLCDTLDGLSDDLQTAITDINAVMTHVAEGDLSRQIDTVLNGELDEMRTNINGSIKVLSRTLSQVAMSSGQVNTTALNLESSSEDLASGSSKQAMRLEEITSSMGIVGKGAKGNEDKANSAQTLTRQSLQETQAGNA